jgi:hypothetical protein
VPRQQPAAGQQRQQGRAADAVPQGIALPRPLLLSAPAIQLANGSFSACFALPSRGTLALARHLPSKLQLMTTAGAPTRCIGGRERKTKHTREKQAATAILAKPSREGAELRSGGGPAVQVPAPQAARLAHALALLFCLSSWA